MTSLSRTEALPSAIATAAPVRPASEPHDPLWQRLAQFEVGGSPQTHDAFLDTLARDQGLIGRAKHDLFREYLKFIYLAATSTVERTPSRLVDEVWHLHLEHADSYERDLCRDILGKPLTHEPGVPGSMASRVRYRQQYAETLAAYEAVFNTVPPDAFWPRPGAIQKRLNGTGSRIAMTTGALAGGAAFLSFGLIAGICLAAGGFVGTAAWLNRQSDYSEDYVADRRNSAGACGSGCGGGGNSGDAGGGDGGSSCGGGGCGGGCGG